MSVTTKREISSILIRSSTEKALVVGLDQCGYYLHTFLSFKFQRNKNNVKTCMLFMCDSSFHHKYLSKHHK